MKIKIKQTLKLLIKLCVIGISLLYVKNETIAFFSNIFEPQKLHILKKSELYNLSTNKYMLHIINH